MTVTFYDFMKRQISKVKPLKIFKLAHERSRAFLREDSQGPRAKDDLRAAVVFAVVAVDAYFRVKVIHVLRTRRASKKFPQNPTGHNCKKTF